MGLSESSLTAITKPFSLFHVAKCHVIHHAVLRYVAIVIIAFLIWIPMNLLAIVIVNILINILIQLIPQGN